MLISSLLTGQAIKQKLQIKVRTNSAEESSSPQEEDKAKLLFGSRVAVRNYILNIHAKKC